VSEEHRNATREALVSIVIRDDKDGAVTMTLASDPPVPAEQREFMTSAQIIALAMLSHGVGLLGDSIYVTALHRSSSQTPRGPFG
jgi:hypothetical protein